MASEFSAPVFELFRCYSALEPNVETLKSVLHDIIKIMMANPKIGLVINTSIYEHVDEYVRDLVSAFIVFGQLVNVPTTLIVANKKTMTRESTCLKNMFEEISTQHYHQMTSKGVMYEK